VEVPIGSDPKLGNERHGTKDRADLTAHKGMHTRPPTHLTTREAATALRVTVDTIQRSIADGRIPGRKVGRRWLIPADHIESLLNAKL
jgi:excisionase family DNA binding protein